MASNKNGVASFPLMPDASARFNASEIASSICLSELHDNFYVIESICLR